MQKIKNKKMERIAILIITVPHIFHYFLCRINEKKINQNDSLKKLSNIFSLSRESNQVPENICFELR